MANYGKSMTPKPRNSGGGATGSNKGSGKTFTSKGTGNKRKKKEVSGKPVVSRNSFKKR